MIIADYTLNFAVDWVTYPAIIGAAGIVAGIMIKAIRRFDFSNVPAWPILLVIGASGIGFAWGDMSRPSLLPDPVDDGMQQYGDSDRRNAIRAEIVKTHYDWLDKHPPVQTEPAKHERLLPAWGDGASLAGGIAVLFCGIVSMLGWFGVIEKGPQTQVEKTNPHAVFDTAIKQMQAESKSALLALSNAIADVKSAISEQKKNGTLSPMYHVTGSGTIVTGSGTIGLFPTPWSHYNFPQTQQSDELFCEWGKLKPQASKKFVFVGSGGVVDGVKPPTFPVFVSAMNGLIVTEQGRPVDFTPSDKQQWRYV